MEIVRGTGGMPLQPFTQKWGTPMMTAHKNEVKMKTLCAEASLLCEVFKYEAASQYEAPSQYKAASQEDSGL